MSLLHLAALPARLAFLAAECGAIVAVHAFDVAVECGVVVTQRALEATIEVTTVVIDALEDEFAPRSQDDFAELAA